MQLKIQNFKNLYHRVLSNISAMTFDYPGKKLYVIGVTGTDGKTTTSTLINHILRRNGERTILISTVTANINGKKIETGLHTTSPDAWTLNRLLSEAVKAKCGYAVIEVTSHGLDQHRFEGIDFKIGVLTNITHEHIDYHKTFQKYITSKAKLFVRVQVAVLNQKDKTTRLVEKYIESSVKKIFYGDALSKQLEESINERFSETYNKMNARAAIAIAKELGVSDLIIIKGIKSFPGVPGRMEEIKNNKALKIFVDFAHTPNALKNVLIHLKKEKKGRLIVVFGCAGERDIKKRPMMAKISTDLADLSIFTAEDPRYERVGDIIKQMESGVTNRKFISIPDRKEAIYLAVNKFASKGDTIVVCGKGHEQSMALNGIEYPWSDKKALVEVLNGYKTT